MAKPPAGSAADAADALEAATKKWHAAKKRERAERDALAALVSQVVHDGILSENKVARVTSIPRMTIRKMLGKH